MTEMYEKSYTGVLSIRFIMVGLFLVGVVSYSFLQENYWKKETNNTFDPIPMYGELNELFENLKSFLQYNNALLFEIHNIVKEIANIHVYNQVVEKKNVIQKNITLRKKIEEMQLYIPHENHPTWEENIKKIIQIVQHIIKEITQKL